MNFFIEDFAAALTELSDDPFALIEVAPEFSRVKKMKLVPIIAEKFAHTRVMEKEAAFFVDNVETGGAVLENIEELTIAFYELSSIGSAQVIGHSGPQIWKYALSNLCAGRVVGFWQSPAKTSEIMGRLDAAKVAAGLRTACQS